MGTEFRVLALNLLESLGKTQGKCVGVIFVDAKEAFYAILRTLVVPIYESDQAVYHLLDRLNLPTNAMADLRTLLKKTPVMEAAGLPRPFIDDVASTYTATHFRVRGTSSIACAQKAPGLGTLTQMWCLRLLSIEY